MIFRFLNRRRVVVWLVFLVALLSGSTRGVSAPPTPTATTDPLGRLNPRAAVTNFLQACHRNDYAAAAQYLDLSKLPTRQRASAGPQLASQLESVLNSARSFDILLLSQDPQGNLTDDPDPSLEHVVTVSNQGQDFTIELVRFQPTTGPAVWLFTPQTVQALPELVPAATSESAIAAKLPRFLVTNEILETPLWKWIALLILAFLITAITRAIEQVLFAGGRRLSARMKHPENWAWLQEVLQPALVLVATTAFRILEEFINPSALGRVYIGRFLLLIVVFSLAWALSNLIELAFRRVDRMLDPRQRVVSHSLLYLGRRATRAIVIFLAGVIVLSNWGYNMTTIIAGLGVGGIAIALAAQQTIANIFGGVSVIGDHPIMVGDLGNFGGLIGTVEDIGMRSTRVRTLSRTVVSIPNSSFASMNLENYSVRDKILFNPTLQLKRTIEPDKVKDFTGALRSMLAKHDFVEVGDEPVRISGYSAASYAVEIFAYVRTIDLDVFYRHQAELFLAINQVVTETGVEIV
jgi:MscS family membrane protein